MEKKICKVCGKAFAPKKKAQEYCGKSCAAYGRARVRKERKDATPMGKREKDLVRVRITKMVPVFPEMRPRVGGVYMAERVRQKRGSGGMFYVIREIGTMGLVVRENECVEV